MEELEVRRKQTTCRHLLCFLLTRLVRFKQGRMSGEAHRILVKSSADAGPLYLPTAHLHPAAIINPCRLVVISVFLPAMLSLLSSLYSMCGSKTGQE